MVSIKKIFLGILIVISTICVALDGWFGYIHFFGKEKVNGNTFYLSDQTITKTDALTGETIEESQIFCSVNINKNAIELKFINFMDENQQSFFSYGVQLICKDGKTTSDSDIFKYNFNKNDEKDLIYHKQEDEQVIMDTITNIFVKTKGTIHYYKDVVKTHFNNFDIYEYQSVGTDFDTPQTSNFLVDNNVLFKIKIGNEIYGMKFKEYDLMYKDGTTEEVLNTKGLTQIASEQSDGVDIGGFWKADVHYYNTDTYRALDLTYFIEWLVNSTTGLKSGLETENYFKVPDMFRFYKYDEKNGSYTSLITDESEQVHLSNEVSNYFRISVKNNRETELSSTKQSMFKIIANNSNFGNDDSTNYTVGRFVLKLTNKDLEYVLNEENKAVFTIKDEVYDKYKNKSIYLFVTINLDDQNLTYGGFNLKDNSKFTIYKIVDSAGNNLLEVANA